MATQELQPSNSRSGASTALLNNPKIRSYIFQSILIALIIWAFWSMWENLDANRKAQNIQTGFDFLWRSSGFAISFSPFLEYSESASYFRVFLVGLQNTLFLSITGIVFATIVGFLIGISRLSQNWVINKMAYWYVEILRNVPLLLQIFIWYKGVGALLPSKRSSYDLGIFGQLNAAGLYAPNPVTEPGFGFVMIASLIGIAITIAISYWAKGRQLQTGQRFPVFWTGVGLIFGIPILLFLALGLPMTFEYPVAGNFGPRGGLRITPEFLALWLALSLYTGAFIAEIVRAGILAVNKGQTEAYSALGLSRGQGLRLVVIPQAMRVIIPPLTSQYLNLTKNSSLATAIAYPDLTAVFAGTALNQAGQAVEFMAITMLTYLTISLLTSLFMNWFNARTALVER